MDSSQYVRLAEKELLNLVESEGAVTWLEVEAKLGRSALKLPGQPLLPTGINPHHLTTARQHLRGGALHESGSPTRGGQYITTLTLAGTAAAKAVRTAAARKRLLQARYLGWARDTPKRRSLIGAGGERATHSALLAAAGQGYKLLGSPGNVARLFGQPVPGGPLDGAAHLVVMEKGMPSGVATVVIEVKNIREWVYPEASELFQLLDKASRLVAQHPDQPIVPMLVCRKANYETFRFAKMIGCFIAQTNVQFILPYTRVEAGIAEIQNELGFHDLVIQAEPHRLLSSLFESTVPSLALEISRRFHATAPILSKYSGQLRQSGLGNPQRARLYRRLHRELSTLPLLPTSGAAR